MYLLGYEADTQLLATCSKSGFLFSLFFDSDMFLRNVGLTFNGLYSVILQKIQFVITTA
jgi:hypothetical protein